MIRKGRLAFGSWSTFGQTALLIIAALLVAQALTVFLVRGILDEWQHSYVEQPTIRRYADVARQISVLPQNQRETVLGVVSQPGERFWLTREAHFTGFGRDNDLGREAGEALQKAGVKAGAVAAFRGGDFANEMFFSAQPHGMPPPGVSGFNPRTDQIAGDDLSMSPPLPGNGPAMMFGPAGHGPHGRDVLHYAALLSDGNWLIGRFVVMRSFPLFLNPIFLSQAALFVILLAGTLFWASRISRPLRILARAAEGLHPQEQFEPIPVQGPGDVKAAINSFNTMALRVRELVHEKDRMLTAIGHDLRTPLASLRIRAESIEPEAEREKIIETIEDMTAMVEEILALARLGYSTEPRQRVDVAALADAVVEEYSSLGLAVGFVESDCAPVAMQAGQVRRLLRNLIDNAVKFGMKATVSVCVEEGRTEVIIDDEGPGIPPERLSEVLQPFSRLESSRSRLTGGSGLGLTIADAIARSQGASLLLENRPSGGLRAIVRWMLPDRV